MQHYDAIIIGTGQAGVPLANTLNEEGWKTAIIEKGPPGGTCVNTGCTPTKMYKASAQRAQDVRTGEALGVITQQLEISLHRIWERKESNVRDSRKNIESTLKEAEHVNLIYGHARFVDNHEVEVNGERLTADKIFINVGARPIIPEAFADQGFMTNREILELKTIPEHLIIIGGSYIGLEFGQMFRRFGSEVTIVEKNDRIISKEDKSISSAIQEILEKEGINFRLGVECLKGERRNNKAAVILGCEKDREIEGSHLLLAVGRQPNTDDLGLEHTDIDTDDGGYIKVNQMMANEVAGVYALGDCNGEGAFTHTAYNDYQIIKNQLFGDGSRTLSDRIMAYGLYIEPALGRVGLTETQAREAGSNIEVFEMEMSKVARANQKNKSEGLLRLMVDIDTDLILGAAFLGMNGDELINGIADLMYAQAPYTTLRDAMHIHPTVAELLPTMLER